MEPVLIDIKAVCSITGLTRSRVYELKDTPTSGFPQPTKIGKSVRWYYREVVAWAEGFKAPIQERSTEAAPRVARTGAVIRVGKVAQLGLDGRLHLVPPQYRERRAPEVWTPNVALYIKRSGNPLTVIGGSRKGSGRALLLKRFGAAHDQGLATSHAPAERDLGRAQCRAVKPPSSGLNAAALRNQYEHGATADQLAESHGIGKAKVLRLLREAGTEIRKAGRRTTKTHHWPKL